MMFSFLPENLKENYFRWIFHRLRCCSENSKRKNRMNWFDGNKEHTVDLHKRAMGWPRIDSEYKDAAELIFSTTKIIKMRICHWVIQLTSQSIWLTNCIDYRCKILIGLGEIDMRLAGQCSGTHQISKCCPWKVCSIN